MTVARYSVRELPPPFPEAGGAQELPAAPRQPDDRQNRSAAARAAAPLPVAGSGPATFQVSRP